MGTVSENKVVFILEKYYIGESIMPPVRMNPFFTYQIKHFYSSF